ncbi:MAG TPA: SBBP repeat-containing protein [Terriglobia bacterium]|nr:SBBP repeat-containing protein [Terriglobia bacterium]
MQRSRFLSGIAGGFLLLLLTAPGITSRPQTSALGPGNRAHPAASAVLSKPDPAARHRFLANYGKLPLSFEANDGQTDSQVKFLARGSGYTLFLTGTEAVLSTDHGRRARMALVGANPKAPASGVDELPGKSSYFIGNDPKKWRTHVPSYAKVKYEDVYPGVDLVYHGNQGELEYDFVVAPGADSGAVRLRFAGGRRVQIDRKTGDLLLRTGNDLVRFKKPVVYQGVAGPRAADSTLVEGRYKLTRRNQVTFELGAYDRTKPLVIDPTLGYSTYLGGSGQDEATAIAVDSLGDAYVTGQTLSVNFPSTAGALQPTNKGLANVFITELDPSGSALVYSTYLGGIGSDAGESIALDAAGDAYVTGQTSSADFPITPGAFQSKCAGTCSTADPDAFVTELNAAGSALIYSTYLGGTGFDQGNGITLDPSGDAFVVGWTGSKNFPTTPGSAKTKFGGGRYDAFVVELNPSGSALSYSTYLGGTGLDVGYAIALDSSGNAYVTGYTESTNFPTVPGAFQTALNAPEAAFVTKLIAGGSAFAYSTYLGGSGTGKTPCATCGASIAVDSGGNAYVSGLTWEVNFPTTAGAFQTKFAGGGGHDAFLTKVNPSGSALVYSTYVGGTNDDGAVAIKVDSAGILYVRGNTFSKNFPVTPGAFQPSFGGATDAFFLELNPTGSALDYSTYLGGAGKEFGGATSSLALDSSASPSVYLTGYTNSTNYPTTAGTFQTTFAGVEDAFIAKFAPERAP